MDKLSLCGKLILEKKKLSWEVFKSTLYIQKLLGYKEALKYSCDNLKGEGQRIMARLDKVYISGYLAQNQANNISDYVAKVVESNQTTTLFLVW